LNEAISRDQLRPRDELITDNQQLRTALASSQAEASSLFFKTLELDSRRFCWKSVAFFLAIALVSVLIAFGYWIWGVRP
jgi:hypothetical protein